MKKFSDFLVENNDTNVNETATVDQFVPLIERLQTLTEKLPDDEIKQHIVAAVTAFSGRMGQILD
jgi:hypothetical protein